MRKIFARPLGDTTTFRSEVGDAIDYYFFYGPTADEIIAGYRQATGDAPLFPKAAYGFWQCRERYSSQAQMLAAASRISLQAKFPWISSCKTGNTGATTAGALTSGI